MLTGMMCKSYHWDYIYIVMSYDLLVFYWSIKTVRPGSSNKQTIAVTPIPGYVWKVLNALEKTYRVLGYFVSERVF